MTQQRSKKKTVKRGAAKKTTAKKKTPAKKTTVKKTPAKKTAVKKTAVKKKPAKKTPAKKTTAKKTTAKKTAAKKTTARKTTARKTTAKKTTAKKTTAKKATAKKTTAKTPSPRQPTRPAIIWDYSDVPRREWGWRLGKYDHRSVVSEPAGLRYWVDDFWDTHGGGFQSYDEFLARGPTNQMPPAIRDEVRDHIGEHRAPGGAHLTLEIATKSPRHRLWRAFLSCDEGTICTIAAPRAVRRNPLEAFAGVLPKGPHLIGWALVFEPVPSTDKRRWIAYGKCQISLRHGMHQLRLEVHAAKDGEVLVKPYLGSRKLKAFEIEQRAYSSEG